MTGRHPSGLAPRTSALALVARCSRKKTQFHPDHHVWPGLSDETQKLRPFSVMHNQDGKLRSVGLPQDTEGFGQWETPGDSHSIC